MLKEYRGPRSPKLFTGSNLPQSLQPRPAAILAKRTLVGQTGSRTEVLVDWEGLPREESTWEEWSKLVQLFPEVDLEDKVILEGGLDDTNPSSIEESPVVSNPAASVEEPSAKTTNVGQDEEVDHDPRRSNRVRSVPVWAKDYCT